MGALGWVVCACLYYIYICMNECFYVQVYVRIRFVAVTCEFVLKCFDPRRAQFCELCVCMCVVCVCVCVHV